MNMIGLMEVVRSLPELWVGLRFTLLLVFTSLAAGAVIGLLVLPRWWNFWTG